MNRLEDMKYWLSDFSFWKRQVNGRKREVGRRKLELESGKFTRMQRSAIARGFPLSSSHPQRLFKLSFLSCIFSFFGLTSAFGQINMDSIIHFSVKQATISEALDQLSAQQKLSIAYSDNFFKKKKKINLELKEVRMADVLGHILKGTDVKFKLKHQQLILFLDKIKKKKRYTISGYVSASTSGERLIGVNIYHRPSGKWTTSNEYGFYSITLLEGELDLTFSYLGCKEKTQNISLDQSIRQDINLVSTITLSEIVIKPGIDSTALKSLASSGQLMPPNYLAIAPSIGGESDIVGLAKSLPGVQSGADGFGGLYVRGGEAGQNLMLLDGVPIYNASHLLGIFSVYNSDAVRSAKLMKGEFPARFGGRISSVFDVHTKEGNQKEWNSNVGLGLISGQAMVDGPILKKKGTILLAARHTHSNFLLDNVFKNTLSSDSDDYNFNFFDINAKVSYDLGKRDRLFFSFYKGNDIFDGDSFQNGAEISSFLKWGNTVAALRWNKIWGARLFSNTTITYSKYEYQNSVLVSFDDIYGYNYEDPFYFFQDKRIEIKDLSLKVDFDFIPNPKHYVRFGLNLTKHIFTPGSTQFEFSEDLFPEEDDIDLEFLTGQYLGISIPATEFAAYAEDDYKLTKKLNLNLGLRASGFIHNRDQFFFNLEPRANLIARLSQKISANISASRMIQYVQQVSSTGVSLPDDLYLPSSEDQPPVKSWMFEVGSNFTLSKGLNLSVETYYKQMSNLLSTEAEEQIIVNSDFSIDGLVVGKGTTYGLELMLEKKGKTGGWLSYTLANSNRQFDDQNRGRTYAFQFDRRQTINVFAYHHFNSKLNFSLNWTYGSGTPEVLLFDPSLTLDNEPIPTDNNQKNEIRTKAYHRLDANLTYQFPIKKTHHTFKIGAYNLYNRKNTAFNRSFLTNNGNISSRPVTLLYFTPSLFYQIRF